MTRQQFIDIAAWQRRTFTGSNVYSKLEHLKKELSELTEAVASQSKDKRFEFADCFILLFGAADADGMSYDDICQAIGEKHKINEGRKWGLPDANGVVEHIKAADEIVDGPSNESDPDPLTPAQIMSVVEWLNLYEQLRETVIPMRFKEDFSCGRRPKLVLSLLKSNISLIETLVKKVEAATGEEVTAVYGHTTRKEILRAQYNSRQGTWRIVKKTSNGHGGWRMFGDSTGYSSKGEAEGKVKKLVERFPNLYMEG